MKESGSWMIMKESRTDPSELELFAWINFHSRCVALCAVTLEYPYTYWIISVKSSSYVAAWVKLAPAVPTTTCTGTSGY